MPCVRSSYLARLGIRPAGRAPPAPLRAPVRTPERGPEARPKSPIGGKFDALSDVSTDASTECGDSEPETPPGAGAEESPEGSQLPDSLARDDFRARYLQKLAYRHVWVPRTRQPPKHQTAVIFDWDDTLLCTTWLKQAGEKPELQDGIHRFLRRIAKEAIALLEASMKMGQTFIVTNAQTGWVEYSAAKWVPEMLPILRKVPVISARAKFEGMYPDDVNMWKTETFLEVRRKMFDPTVITNLLALGDSEFEMEAAQIMGKEFEQALLKTVKFRRSPTPAELLKQLELVKHKFENILSVARPLKILLERRSASDS